MARGSHIGDLCRHPSRPDGLIVILAVALSRGLPRQTQEGSAPWPQITHGTASAVRLCRISSSGTDGRSVARREQPVDLILNQARLETPLPERERPAAPMLVVDVRHVTPTDLLHEPAKARGVWSSAPRQGWRLARRCAASRTPPRSTREWLSEKNIAWWWLPRWTMRGDAPVNHGCVVVRAAGQSVTP
ncbi:MAG: hypothetical protein ACFCVA_03055 [Gammaproteobacteria bacterium]